MPTTSNTGPTVAETNLDNLVLLCRYHHRLIHVGGFGLNKASQGNLEFIRPDGKIIEPSPTLPCTGKRDALIGMNQQAGLNIDAHTYPIPPGDVMDYDLAVSGLLN